MRSRAVYWGREGRQNALAYHADRDGSRDFNSSCLLIAFPRTFGSRGAMGYARSWFFLSSFPFISVHFWDPERPLFMFGTLFPVRNNSFSIRWHISQLIAGTLSSYRDKRVGDLSVYRDRLSYNASTSFRLPSVTTYSIANESVWKPQLRRQFSCNIRRLMGAGRW